MTQRPVLNIEDLTVTYAGGRQALRGVSLSLDRGKCLGIVGELGAGKSTIARAILGILPSRAEVRGSIRLEGTELVGMEEVAFRRFRGLAIGMVVQDPYASLNPVAMVGAHVAEAWRAHGLRPPQGIVARRLGAMGIAEPERAERRFPHQWSGGMLQRASIAAASAHTPALIVADEPTSALDADRAHATIAALRHARSALLLISHNIGLVGAHADSIAVCYAGQIVEVGDAEDIVARPRHPYTRALVAALPRARGTLPRRPEATRDAMIADRGCAFATRCTCVDEICLQFVPRLEGTGVACHRPLGGTAAEKEAARRPRQWVSRSGAAVVEARAVSRAYGGLSAVNGADLRVERGEIVGISGPSGSGKSTLLRLLAGIEAPTSGSVVHPAREERRIRSGFVMPVFQNPTQSLDARWPIWRTVTEPLTARDRPRLRGAELRLRAGDLLERVGLAGIDPEARPGELSLGQCQRVAIARAIAADPMLVVADEPTSALDALVQATILHALADLAEQGAAIVIVSHDRPVLEALATRLIEMREGTLDHLEFGRNA